jgi:hypothetical protein
LEQFDLHLYDDGDQQLEITAWDKDRSRDDFIGRQDGFRDDRFPLLTAEL